MTIRAPWRNEENLKELRRLHANTDAKSYEVVIEDAGHFSFSDLPHVAPKKFGAKIDALTGHVQISRIMLEFLSELFGQENDLSFILDSRVSKPKNIMVSIYKSNE